MDPRWRLFSVAVVSIGATLLSVWAGLPSNMPGVSLGWPLLLHVQRAAALLATVGAVLLIGARAARGQFPARIGHVEYPVEGVDARTEIALDVLRDRVHVIEKAMGLKAGSSPGH